MQLSIFPIYTINMIVQFPDQIMKLVKMTSTEHILRTRLTAQICLSAHPKSPQNGPNDIKTHSLTHFSSKRLPEIFGFEHSLG